ncbi:hypothetical protein A8139_11500 [Marinomonas primoryensis]|uniref:DUF4064 domain-containing protein n=1 Tax=Marinomonas primoryensis TaxID=178399 RepID=A0A2Z4PU16_9GAMM|nr:DUF6463 family protein [Marinomonas primoryensis]AWY00544.1 hypothetical protein A8139_11500 [Marinomonas primoryensis]
MKPMKYSGYYLVATGVIHSLIGLALGWNTLIEMHQDHWLSSTVINGQMLFDREAIVWFLLSGFFWILFGIMLQKALNEGFTPPLSLAWGFILIGVLTAVIMPISGAYLFIIQGFILLLGIHKNKK